MEPVDPIRTRPTLTHCVFCGGTPLSDEHLWSRWTHRYIKKASGKYETLQALAEIDRTNYRIGRKAGTIYDRQVRCVCGRCNSGWMSQLEDRVKPIALPLILGEQARITPRDQAALAAWCALKAIIAEFESSVISTEEQRRRLRVIQRAPRRGFRIWVGNVDAAAAGASWSFHPFLVVSDPKGLGEPATWHNSGISTQIIGKLLVHVFRSAVEGLPAGWNFDGRTAGYLRCIWPAATSSIKWPPPPMPQAVVDLVASQYFNRLLQIGARLNERFKTGQ